MLQLKNIVKQYGEGENAVKALGGVSISFRENEFVSILGHSGCGKILEKSHWILHMTDAQNRL